MFLFIVRCFWIKVVFLMLCFWGFRGFFEYFCKKFGCVIMISLFNIFWFSFFIYFKLIFNWIFDKYCEVFFDLIIWLLVNILYEWYIWFFNFIWDVLNSVFFVECFCVINCCMILFKFVIIFFLDFFKVIWLEIWKIFFKVLLFFL